MAKNNIFMSSNTYGTYEEDNIKNAAILANAGDPDKRFLSSTGLATRWPVVVVAQPKVGLGPQMEGEVVKGKKAAGTYLGVETERCPDRERSCLIKAVCKA